MKNWSIKKKLFAVNGSLLVIILILGLAAHFSEGKLTAEVNDAVAVDLPAVRSATLADMMHDGLRSVVYRALFVSTLENNLEEKKETAEELKEFSQNLLNHLEDILKLQVAEDSRKSVEESLPKAKEYVAAAEEIVGLALTGRRDQAVEKIPKFQEAFENLEKKLESVGDTITKDAENSRLQAEKDSDFLTWLNVILAGFGFLLGGLLSFWIVRDLTRTFSSVITDLSNSSGHVSQASTESASSANTLSEASTEQAASLQETMASIEEISAMVAQNAESANKAKSAVDANQQVSDEGSRSVSNMLKAIDEIKETNDKILNQMESSNKEFGEIVKIISEIGDKTKVINDIVFQTKLLSFNASVEAARAGEHGKGFAVVAEEVGNLAQMSGNAAKEITDMLTNSIKKVNEIVETTTQRVDQLVEVGKDKISMGQATAQKSRESLEKISENARMVASMVTEITHASKEQAQGVQEINKAISQLDQVTQQNSSVAQRSSSQAEQLNKEAQVLASAVDSLVTFVNGAGANVSNTKAKPLAKEVKITSKVIPLKKATSEVTATSHVPTKKVVHGDSVPSSDDPNFEEF